MLLFTADVNNNNKNRIFINNAFNTPNENYLNYFYKTIYVRNYHHINYHILEWGKM